jgi:hypothetical protein
MSEAPLRFTQEFFETATIIQEYQGMTSVMPVK